MQPIFLEDGLYIPIEIENPVTRQKKIANAIIGHREQQNWNSLKHSKRIAVRTNLRNCGRGFSRQRTVFTVSGNFAYP